MSGWVRVQAALPAPSTELREAIEHDSAQVEIRL